MNVGKLGQWVVNKSDFKLLDLELNGLGIEYFFNDSRLILLNFSEELFRVAHLAEINNKPTHYFQFIKNFGNLNNYAFHGICPYKGKFYPRLPRTIINFFHLKNNDWILDPFCGSGTTNLEAQLMGINSFGFDISPYASFISEIKTKLIEVDTKSLDLSVRSLSKIYNKLNNRTFSLYENIVDLIFIFSYLDVKDLKSRINSSHSLFKLFVIKIRKILDMIIKTKEIMKTNHIKPGIVHIVNENALNIESFFKKKFDAIITSPPYLFSLNYLNRNQFFNKSFKINVNKVKNMELGRNFKSDNHEKTFKLELKKVLEIFDKIIKLNGKIGIVMSDGKFRGITTKNSQFIIEEGKKFDWELLKIINNPIIGQNTKSIFKENIILFKKK